MIVNSGEKVSHFFANELQNRYYHYLFLSNAKKWIGTKQYNVDSAFQQESIAYWKKHSGLKINPLWHNFYFSRNGIRDVRYIPENIYYSKIEPHLNRKDFAQAIDDKCFYSERFPVDAVDGGVHRPCALLRNVGGIFFDTDFTVLGSQQAAKNLSSVDSGYVIKESITGSGGNRILFVEPGHTKTQEELLAVFEKYHSDFVVESIIDQCEEMSSLNSSSINTIRFITYLNQKGVHLLSAVLRIGADGSRTDNFSTGGIGVGITLDGKLKSVAYNQHYEQFFTHPNGTQFAGFAVPSFERAKDLVLTLHRRFGHFRIISWDVAIGINYEPVLIEFNITPQSIDLHQINNGPLFGEYTEEVLSEVFV